MRLSDMLVQFIRKEEYNVKIIATCAISNAILGSNEEQCRYVLAPAILYDFNFILITIKRVALLSFGLDRYFRTKCVPQLEKLAETDDLEVHRMISKIYDTLDRKEKFYRKN